MTYDNSEQIKLHLEQIQNRIIHVATQANRDPNDIRLVAVSKFHPRSAVDIAIKNNQTIFGENRIQEAKDKFRDIRQQNPNIHLHIIGPIQSNKIIDAVKVATVIETLDRPSLIQHLEKAIDKVGYCPKLFIQINTGKEPQKAGILPKDADAFISLCCKHFGNAVQGVMGIPPVHTDPIPHFKQLTSFARKYHLPEISMGMSADFETAITYGATFVRIGSAIFGARPRHENLSE